MKTYEYISTFHDDKVEVLVMKLKNTGFWLAQKIKIFQEAFGNSNLTIFGWFEISWEIY